MGYGICICIIFSLLLLCAEGTMEEKIFSLDLGNDYAKLAYKDGSVIKLVENDEDSRKTPSIISFNKDEVIFGARARSLVYKRPEKTFTLIKRLLGARRNDPLVDSHAQAFSSFITEDDRAAPLFPSADLNFDASVEELLAFQMLEMLKLGWRVAGKSLLTQLILTVPIEFTEQQRDCFRQAAELIPANLSLHFIDDLLAASIEYSVRFYDDLRMGSNRVLVVNAGASGFSAAAFDIVKSGAGKRKLSVRTVRLNYTHAIGGFQYDQDMAEYLGMVFGVSNPDVVWNLRSPLRLLIAARNVKEMAAHGTTPVYAAIEHLAMGEDIEFRTTVTKSDFEESIKPGLEQYLLPLLRDLTSNEKIDVIELFGGLTRIPLIGNVVQQAMPEGLVVGRHLNGDEAAVLGAAHYLSRDMEIEIHPHTPISEPSHGFAVSGIEAKAFKARKARVAAAASRHQQREESIAAKIELESGVIAAREHLEQCTAPNPIHDQLERAIRLAQEWIDDSEHLVSSSLYQKKLHEILELCKKLSTKSKDEL